jgi:type VI secretion system protein ImpL
LDGYREMTERLKESVADEFRKDDWVMRTNVAVGENLDAKKDELANIYYRDYVAQWQRFLAETKVRDYQSKEDAVRTLRLLAGSTSPLESVLQEVAKQTNLSGAGGGGFFGWLKGLFASKTGTGLTPVDKEFRPLQQFVSGKDETSPIREYRTQLQKVADALNANNKSLAELSKAMQAGNDTIGLRPARQAVADSLESKGFNTTPASDAAARVIKLPLDNLNTLLVGTDFDQIEKLWQGLYAKEQGFESGFPFSDGGSDISLAALAQFLNPQDGDLTKFFNERLKPYFEDDWSVKKEAADKFSPAFVTYLANAKRLRDALFPDGGKQPKAEYQLTLAPVQNALARVDADGGSLQTPDKTTANLVWPGDKSGVKVTLTPTNGQDIVKNFAGEWGLLHMFRESGGGDGKTAPFSLQVGSVRLTLQPKSGNPFARELFTALKAPKSVRQQ